MTPISDARAAVRRAITATESTWQRDERAAILEELRLLRLVEASQTDRMNRRRVAQRAEVR